MKKLIVITGMILAAYLLLMTVAQPRADAPSTASVLAENEASDSYTVGVSEGKVAVFRSGRMVLRTDTHLSSLPKADRVRLEKGIRIDSVKELKVLLQDYCT